MSGKDYVPADSDAAQAYSQLPEHIQDLLNTQVGTSLVNAVNEYILKTYPSQEVRQQMAELFFMACGTPVIDWHADDSEGEATPEAGH